MPRGALPESKEITEANKRYSAALIRVLKLLGVSQRSIAKRLGVSDGLVTRWAKAHKTVQAEQAHSLFAMIQTAVRDFKVGDWDDTNLLNVV